VPEEIDEEATAVREAVRVAVMSRGRRMRRKPDIGPDPYRQLTFGTM